MSLITNISTQTVLEPSDIQYRLNYFYKVLGLSWRQIASLDDYRPIPPGSLCTFAKTGELADKWRVRLGLPPKSSRVQVIFGYVPDGSQVIGAEECDCGEWYISNHPKRGKCFMCSPYKGIKHRKAKR